MKNLTKTTRTDTESVLFPGAFEPDPAAQTAQNDARTEPQRKTPTEPQHKPETKANRPKSGPQSPQNLSQKRAQIAQINIPDAECPYTNVVNTPLAAPTAPKTPREAPADPPVSDSRPPDFVRTTLGAKPPAATPSLPRPAPASATPQPTTQPAPRRLPRRPLTAADINPNAPRPTAPAPAPAAAGPAADAGPTPTAPATLPPSNPVLAAARAKTAAAAQAAAATRNTLDRTDRIAHSKPCRHCGTLIVWLPVTETQTGDHTPHDLIASTARELAAAKRRGLPPAIAFDADDLALHHCKPSRIHYHATKYPNTKRPNNECPDDERPDDQWETYPWLPNPKPKPAQYRPGPPRMGINENEGTIPF